MKIEQIGQGPAKRSKFGPGTGHRHVSFVLIVAFLGMRKFSANGLFPFDAPAYFKLLVLACSLASDALPRNNAAKRSERTRSPKPAGTANANLPVEAQGNHRL